MGSNLSIAFNLVVATLVLPLEILFPVLIFEKCPFGYFGFS